MSFSTRIFFVNVSKTEKKTANLVTYTEETLNKKLHFLCSDSEINLLYWHLHGGKVFT